MSGVSVLGVKKYLNKPPGDGPEIYIHSVLWVEAVGQSG